MTKKLILLAAFSAAMSTQAAVWFQFGGSEYAITSEPNSWYGARAEAQFNGGDLASLGSAAEEDFIQATFAGFNFWIGYTDELVENSFGWTDGSPVTYTNWAPGEPNNLGNEDYTVMNWSGGDQWNDLPNDAFAFGIMERAVEEQPVPEVHHYASMLGAAMIGANILRRRRSAK